MFQWALHGRIIAVLSWIFLGLRLLISIMQLAKQRRADCRPVPSLSLAYAARPAITSLRAVTDGTKSSRHPWEGQSRALATLQAAAALTGINEQALLTTFDQVANDPYTRFTVEVWH